MSIVVSVLIKLYGKNNRIKEAVEKTRHTHDDKKRKMGIAAIAVKVVVVERGVRDIDILCSCITFECGCRRRCVSVNVSGKIDKNVKQQNGFDVLCPPHEGHAFL